MKLMHVILLSVIFHFSTINAKTHATAGLNTQAKPFCEDSAKQFQNSTVLNDLFCESQTEFTGTEICQQMDCLERSHITHCHEELQTISTEKGYSYLQGSVESNVLFDALFRYCESDDDQFHIWSF